MSREDSLKSIATDALGGAGDARMRRVVVVALNVSLAFAAAGLVDFTLNPTSRAAVGLGASLAIAVGLAGAALATGAGRAGLATAGLWLGIALGASQNSLGFRESLWPGFVLDPRVGWRAKPNLRDVRMETPTGSYRISTDERGWRNAHPYPADGSLPIVLQGDSLAFGFGLDAANTYCAVLTERIGVPCFNAGVVGYDFQHALVQGEDLTRRHRIGTRIILVNVGNDYALSALESPYLLRRPYAYLDGERLVAVTDLAMPFAIQAYGHRFIRPYDAYDAELETVSIGRGWGRSAPAWLSHVRLAAFAVELSYPRLAKLWYQAFDEAGLARGQQLSPYYPSWQLQAVDHWPEPYKSFRRDFEALMAAIGRQTAGQTVVVLVPMRAQVILDEQQAIIATHVSDRRTLDFDSVNRVILEAARRAGIVAIDSTPAFRADGAPRRLYQSDQHLSEAGMRLVVEATIAGLGPVASWPARPPGR